jgi:hypothetical protein
MAPGALQGGTGFHHHAHRSANRGGLRETNVA